VPLEGHAEYAGQAVDRVTRELQDCTAAPVGEDAVGGVCGVARRAVAVWGASEHLVGELVGEVQLRDRAAGSQLRRRMDVDRPACVPARVDRLELADPLVCCVPRRKVSDGATISSGTDFEVTTSPGDGVNGAKPE
jgi:hypothetical protein